MVSTVDSAKVIKGFGLLTISLLQQAPGLAFLALAAYADINHDDIVNEINNITNTISSDPSVKTT